MVARRGPDRSRTGGPIRLTSGDALEDLLAVTLQRQTFQVLAACAPALQHAVEGRLGRPLSEAPEFWRAAPEAALQWSAVDFGFPDPLWCDAPSGPPDEDYGRSAVGHLHAAGLRL